MKDSTLYVANVGDSRAVMACQDAETGEWKAKPLTRDHKPDDPEEQARIESWGGYVCPPYEPGLSARVYLDPHFTMIGLAMSRSLGDHAVKNVGVIPEPEVKQFELDKSDRFMILASDGVWEFITSEEAVEIVRSVMETYGVPEACQELIETAAARWQEEEGDYRDDVSVWLLIYMYLDLISLLSILSTRSPRLLSSFHCLISSTITINTKLGQA
jgi:serine/threonine protein phosphatase PrpC